MNESTRALAFIYNRLATDATLLAVPIGGVFRGIAPDNTAAPYIIMALQGGHDVLGSGGARIMADLPIQVSAFAPAGLMNTLQAVADRLDALLDQASGTTSDGRVLAIRRQQIINLDEPVNGVTWTRLGGIYRTWASPLG